MNKVVFKNIVLFVKDIKVSREFYENKLDQKVIHDFGNNIAYEGGLSLWKLSEKHMLYNQLISKQSKQNCNRVEVYFEVDNIKSFYQKLEKNKIRFLHRLHIEEWQQMTIRFFDPDYHLVEVGESLNALIKRLKNEGKTIEQISEITFLDKAFVEDQIKS